MEEHLYDELLIELECPVCTNYMSPPIRQCATGHSICGTCRKKLPKCPLCQSKFTDSRNISLEGLAVKMRYPCINRKSGCLVSLSYTERETHELHCRLKDFKCAMERCGWVGKLEELASHWASKKMSSKPYHKSNICHTKMKTESYYVNMVEAYNKLFWFKCKLTKNKLYWAVQYIGNGAEAENYCYEIEIFKPGRAKKKILMSDYCQSINLDNNKLFNDDACISVGTDTIGSFVSPEQILIYYFRVNLVDQNNVTEIPSKQEVSTTIDRGVVVKQRDPSNDPQQAQHQQNRKKKSANHTKMQHKQRDDFVLL